MGTGTVRQEPTKNQQLWGHPPQALTNQMMRSLPREWSPDPGPECANPLLEDGRSAQSAFSMLH